MLPAGDGGDLEVDDLLVLVGVDVDVEVLVGVDAAQAVEAGGPHRARHRHPLLHAVAVARHDHLRVHEVHAQLKDGSIGVYSTTMSGAQ